MKTLSIAFSVAMICLAFLALIPSRDSKRLSPRTGSQVEEVVYMSDIDGLVKAVMLYGVTNGITFQGTNYVFVVEDMGPATPVAKRETTFHFSGSADETYLIEGTLNQSKLEEIGLYSSDMLSWIKSPTSVTIGNAVTTIDDEAFPSYGCNIRTITIPTSVTYIGLNALGRKVTSATFEGRTMAQVTQLGLYGGYTWGLADGCNVICTDGTITYEEPE